MARITNAELLARIATLEGMLSASAPVASEASAHWKAKDLPCTAAEPCTRTFRTATGRDWHVANIKTTHKAK